MKEKDQEFDKLIDELHSLPEPDYNKRFNANVQEKMHQQIIDFAMNHKKKRKVGAFMKKFAYGLGGLAAVLLFMTIFNPLEIGNDTGSNVDDGVETVQAYLENEFTGPDEELSNILDQGLHPPELDSYLDEHYGDLIADMEMMVNRSYVLTFLRDAHLNGYQLQPKNIDIQRVEGTENKIYDYEVEVDYSKDGQTNSTIVTGKINLDENGEISLIRQMDGRELLEALSK